MTDTRVILHADMDAFYASVEQRDNVELQGKPVVVGGSSPRGVVAAASYEARRFGIHSAMPSIEARRRCPQAIFVRGDMEKYRRESAQIFEIFRSFTPAVEGISLDEAFLDLTGTERLHGSATSVAQALRTRVREKTRLAVSVGIAPIKMVAKIASDAAKPDGWLQVCEGEVQAFLQPLPVGRIWGVGRVAQSRLASIGVVTIGDLAGQSDERLRDVLGDWGVAAARLARGEDAREVQPYRQAKSYGEENTFAQDIFEASRLRAAIRRHSEAVARRLRRDQVRGRGVTLKLKLARGLGEGRYPLLTRSKVLPQATDDGALIAAAGRELLARADLKEPIRLLGISVSHIEAGAFEQLSFLPGEAGDPRRGSLNRAMDAVQDRFGRDALKRGSGDVERAGLSQQIKSGDD